MMCDLIQSLMAVSIWSIQLKEDGIDEGWKATPNDFCWCCDFKRSCDMDIAKNIKLLNPQS